MIRIAIVEDEQDCAKTLENFLRKYEAENNVKFDINLFENGLNFISDYKPVFELVFMDIEMPHLNGIETSKTLYSMDKKVGIIFVTKMAQFAIRGYEVDALDFLVKPVNYFQFSVKMKKALNKLNLNLDKEIVIHERNNVVRIAQSQIYYIQINKHYLVYTTDAGVFNERGTMKQCEQQLGELGFTRCNDGCLVNLKHINKITGDSVQIGDVILPVSRHKRKELVEKYVHYKRGS